MPSHSLVMLASTACQTSWSTNPSTMAFASISSVLVSLSCGSSHSPWGKTNHLSHPFNVNVYWFSSVTHLLNIGELMGFSCSNLWYGLIHTLISCGSVVWARSCVWSQGLHILGTHVYSIMQCKSKVQCKQMFQVLSYKC